MKDEVTRHLRRNFSLGVANGFLFMAGSSLLGPAVILPQFLSSIFESKAAIGIGSNLFRMGWSLPQVAVAFYFRSLRRKKPLYIVGNGFRMLLVGIFILAFFLLQDRPKSVGVLFFVLMGSAALAAGIVGLAYQDIVARVIPSHRRGSYIAYRALGGQGIAALATGFVARYILAHPERYPYPGNYLLIFTMAWLLMVSGVVLFSMVKEPPETQMRPRPRLKLYLFELYLIVKRDRNFRRFLLTQVVRACEGLALPFYIVYARLRLGLPEAAAGTFLIVGILARLPAAVLWGRLSDRLGNRIVIILSAVASMAAPALALLIAVFDSLGLFASPQFSFTLFGFDVSVGRDTGLVWILAPVFAVLAAAQVGGLICLGNYVMDSAPPRRRPLYLGVSTSLTGVLTLAMPLLGGVMIDLTEKATGGSGYFVVFIAAAAAVGLSAVIASRLIEPRTVLMRD